MFENIQKKLSSAFKNLSGQGKISEKNIKEAVRQVKLSLLEADVNYKVVKDFIDKVKEEAMGAKVLESLTPDQEFIRVVRDNLIELMGGNKPEKISLSRNPGFIMLVGLQGSGKTTHAAKLAKMYQKEGRKPLLIAADTYRPAAIDQLVQLGDSLGVPVFTGDKTDARNIVKEGKKYAEKLLHDIVIVDTAGRLHIDQQMMDEVEDIKNIVNPEEIIMVVDSMMGQDAVSSAKEFNDRLELSGFIVTKLDGDSRGGVIISIREITKKPVKFVGVGEKLDEFEPFYAERYAGRILGMGDVLSLIEKVEQEVDKEKAEEDAKRMMEGKITLEDFLQNIKQIRKMGPLSKILEMIPGTQGVDVDTDKGEKEMTKMEAIINSMTPKERKDPKVLTYSRKQRIAKGSGTSLQDINKLLKSYDQLKKTMKQFKKFGKKKFFGNKMPFGM
ncbi:signal recognition particle protein [Oceanotoga sp. DSM 15011]|jgi:signal recognition particle subunit SRP54|uniref:Signal recognition particle protein n=1 Tax=Oceanotoga teriensis TaxID=515440 RepID=A0AA45C7F2_9BACT|nr:MULTISPECIES: signal recognition particle protein [Oceanotoga]MDN5342177.1 signal recognition particle subunit [Oceanotoga sp.]MDO7976196.1 signal recognition particle protein [Oceanotoga teriensis]PWJ95393.1 signal recognition particle subunit FFH/SRP54 (srp54) [Oceanotoga teriensis]UYP01032.1 signal recognition particle protein [Oceanotoga sp. DSM 15011]